MEKAEFVGAWDIIYEDSDYLSFLDLVRSFMTSCSLKAEVEIIFPGSDMSVCFTEQTPGKAVLSKKWKKNFPLQPEH